MNAKTRFPSQHLVPRDGEIDAHIFENAQAGIARSLFWSITINFKPVSYAGKNWNCSMICEWIPWAIRDWRNLRNRYLDVAYGEDGVESSFYMVQHDPGTRTRLWISDQNADVFHVRMEMEVDFTGYCGGDEESAMLVAAEVDVPFTGLLVLPDNLEPKPVGLSGVREIAERFVDLSLYRDPTLQNHAYVLKPKP